ERDERQAGLSENDEPEQNPENPAEQSRPPEARKNIGEHWSPFSRRACLQEQQEACPRKRWTHRREHAGFAMPSNRLSSSTRTVQSPGWQASRTTAALST